MKKVAFLLLFFLSTMLIKAQEINEVVKSNFKFYEKINPNYDGNYVLEVWYSKLLNDYDITFEEQHNENVGFAIMQTIRKQRNSVPEKLKKSGTKQRLFVNVKNHRPTKKEGWYVNKVRKLIKKGKNAKAIKRINKGLKAYPYSVELLSLKISAIGDTKENSAELFAYKVLLEQINMSMWEPVYLYVNQLSKGKAPDLKPAYKRSGSSSSRFSG